MLIAPARNGSLWLTRGFALFRASPGLWLLMVFTYWFLVAAVNTVPWIGPVIATVSLPAFSVSFMKMCEAAAQGRTMAPTLLFSGFRRQLPALLTLGTLYLGAIAGVLAIAALADGGILMNWILWGKPPAAEAIRDGSVSRAMLIATALAAPVLSAFWFSPVLTAWHGMGAGKAMFFSFFACLRNWRAFMVYGAVIAGVGLLLSVLITFLVILLRSRETVQGAMMAITLLALPTLFGSFYASYRDVFPPPDDAPAESGDDAPGQSQDNPHQDPPA